MRYKLALVEYLNTLPFAEGLRLHQLADKFEVFRVPPAQCASLFQAGAVDISLCPVGALSDMPAYELHSRFCIGAEGDVGTVMLLSRVPLADIRSVRLDNHSRTSNLLIQILAERHWKVNWEFIPESPDADDTSCLMIGDKVFAHKDKYPYHYDLAGAWLALTGLPMVFAVWINTPDVPDAVIGQLDAAFAEGINSIPTRTDILEDWQRSYLMHNISYSLDEGKRKALALYLEWAEALTGFSLIR